MYANTFYLYAFYFLEYLPILVRNWMVQIYHEIMYE